jgi:hypothetical protein
MTKLKVAFRNYGNAPIQISSKVNWLPPGTKKNAVGPATKEEDTQTAGGRSYFWTQQQND